jgi:hypothetical protein
LLNDLLAANRAWVVHEPRAQTRFVAREWLSVTQLANAADHVVLR